MGAYGTDKEGPPDIPDVGATYLIHGPISGDISLDQAQATFIGEGEEDYSGWSTAGGADFTGDGTADDILIDAYNADEGGLNGPGVVSTSCRDHTAVK